LNYYVYYKLAPGRAEALRAQVDALFALVEERTGVRGRWMRRRDDPQTYMEVYEGVQDASAFDALLETQGAGLGVERRIERFVCV
jgi:uncharacterized protein DUF4936